MDSQRCYPGGGGKFHVHRSTLAMWSPVFEKMFTSDFKEKQLDEVPLPEKKASEIREMLLVMYVKTKPVTEDNVFFLLDLAQEYQMDLTPSSVRGMSNW